MVSNDPNELKVISVSIPAWMYDWLENEGRKINRSQLFRRAIEEAMRQTVSPLVALASVFGVCFSVALISIAITPTPIHIYARATLVILGGIMTITSTLTYYKEKNRVGGR